MNFIKSLLLGIALVGVIIFGIYFWMLVGEFLFFNTTR